MTRYDFYYEENALGLIIVSQNEKWGVIEANTEKEIVATLYDEVKILKNDFIAIKKGDRWGVAAPYGEIIIPLTYKFVEYFNELYFLVGDEKALLGLVSTEGNLYTQTKYQKISEFVNGFCIVIKSGNYGLINENLEQIIPTEYDCLEFLDTNLLLATKDNNVFVIDINNNIQKTLPYNFACKVTSHIFKVRKNSLYGLIDDEFNEIVLPKYSNIERMSDSLLLTYNFKGLGVICLDDNKVINSIEPQYSWIEILNDDFFVAKNDSYKWALFNSNGTQLTSFTYDEILGVDDVIYIFKGNDVLCSLSVGVIDEQGKEVIPPEYEYVQKLGNGFVIGLNDKYGIYDSNYTQVSKVIFDDVYAIKENIKTGKKFAKVKYQGKVGKLYW